MKKRFDWLVLVLCLSVPLSLHAQSDSLHTVLNNALKENVTMDVVNGYKQLGRFYEANLNYDSAFYYYGLEGEYIKDQYDGVAYDTLIGKVYMDFGYVYLYQENSEMAGKYLDSAELVYKRAESIGNVTRVLNNRGMMLNDMNEFSLAVEYLLEALDYANNNDEVSNKSSVLNSVYINIGNSYIGLEDWENAVKYTKLAAKYRSPVQINNGHVHINLSSAYLNSDSLDLALKEARIAGAIYDSATFVYGKIGALNNIGQVYLKKKEYSTANEYFEEVIRLSNEFQYPLGFIEAWVNRSEIFGVNGEYDKGIAEMLKAEELCNQYNDKLYLRAVKENLAELYRQKGDYKNALLAYEQFKMLNDSLKNVEKTKSVNNLLIKYETAEKDLEIQTQKTTIASRNTQVTLLVSSLGLILLGGTLFYNRNKAKQKQQMQAAIIEEKERGLEAVVQATEEERKRISKDLHDGIGQQLNALKLGLSSVEKKVDGDLKSELSHITSQFTKSADEVRQISHQMMPRALMDDGLVKAVEDLLRNTFQYTEITYDFEHHKMEDRLNERIEISMYRILQELLSNIIKHSEATKVNVQLIRLKDKLSLLVEDNGKGFGNANSNGHGQMNIRNRLDMIKGTVNYEPSAESGVVAVITVPL
ncbi:tetratricopeptide repeat-containing sensor histidine kinase [Roseivirga pacifica]|uniref:tetratricopeptide repeat-containing sensor histidine kinase n=1 Tax=Roseivirga pacifica TaxID=1267423 RepID=UPI00227C025E|nr:histidine kinase [Roseivirga pacifica]